MAGVHVILEGRARRDEVSGAPRGGGEGMGALRHRASDGARCPAWEGDVRVTARLIRWSKPVIEISAPLLLGFQDFTH
eukprot:5891197-Prymnesium_polylepis.1